MVAAKNNKYWELRRDSGRRKIYETPQDLWSAAIDYFQWAEKTPLYGSELVKYQGKYKTAKVKKMRAMTEADFVEHSLMGGWSTWDEYCTGKNGHEDFTEVAARIKGVIKNQKFQGAAADLLNSNIIARDLGLVDKQDATHTLHFHFDEQDKDA